MEWRKIKFFLRKHSDFVVPCMFTFTGMICVILVMHHTEDRSWFDAFYYAVVTATTVGFGDIFANEVLGKIVSLVYIVISVVSFVALVNALIRRTTDLMQRKLKGLVRVKKKMDLMIIGYPSEEKVKKIIAQIRNVKPDFKIVCVTNAIDMMPMWMEVEDVCFIHGRGSRKQILHMANIHETDTILVLAETPQDPRSDEYVSAIVAMCEVCNPKARTIAEKVRDDDDLFENAKCDKVVDVCRPTELAQEVLHMGSIDFIDAICTTDTPEYQDNIDSGNLVDTWYQISKKFAKVGIVAVGYSRDFGHNFIIAPDPEQLVPPHSLIKVIGKNS